MHCNANIRQQAVFWHGNSSPALVLKQLESAVLRALPTPQQQQQQQAVRGLTVPRAGLPARVMLPLCSITAAAAAATVQQPRGQQAVPVLPCGKRQPPLRRCSCTSAVSSQDVSSSSPFSQHSAGQQETSQEPQQQPALPQHQQEGQRQQQQQRQHQHQQAGQEPPAVGRHTLRQLLTDHMFRHRTHRPEGTLRLQRKLTAVMRDGTSSAADVADVLLVADCCCCLNSRHVVAALARLVRLSAAAQAAAGTSAAGLVQAGDDEAAAAAYAFSAVVPCTGQQWQQMRMIKAAAAQAPSRHSRAFKRHNRASSRYSRWHSGGSAAAAAAAGDLLGADEDEQQQQQHLLDQLSAAVDEMWPSMSAASITSCLWSFAHLQYEPSVELLHKAGAALMLMATSLQGPQQHTAQDGTATADDGDTAPGQQRKQRKQWKEWKQHKQEQKLAASLRHVIIVLWALAKLAADLQDLQATQLSPQQQQQQHMHELQRDPASSSSSSSVGDGGSSSILHHVLLCLTPHLPDLGSQGLLLLLWAAATLCKNSSSSSSSDEVPLLPIPAAAAAALLSASAAAMDAQALTPRGLAVVMWSGARLGLTPDAAWLGAWLAAMHEALPAAGPQDLTVATWGLAHMGVPPPVDWLGALSRRATAVAPQLSGRELPVLLWGFARLRYRPGLMAAHALLQQGGVLASRGALSPQGLALLLWSSGVLGVELPGRWVDGVLAAAAGFLPLFQPLEASGLWVALVKLQHIPQGAWMDVWWGGSKGLLAAAGAQQLVLLLWSAVRLGQAPPSHWMRSWLAAAQSAMSRGEVTAQGYGLMWDALAQVAPTGLIPSEEWLCAFWSASCQPGVMNSLDPLTVEKVLTGLAAVSAQLDPEGLSLPPAWLDSFLPASLRVLPGAKLVTLGNLLLAARQLALPLPPVWLAAVMARLQQQLMQANILLPGATHNSRPPGDSAMQAPGSSSSSGVGSSRSLVLSVRLQRRWQEVCLQRVLSGLRAQHMLTPAAQRRLWARAQQEAAAAAWGPTAAAAAAVEGAALSSSRSSSSGSDALSVWPWLSDAVYNVWPDRASAQQALQVLSMH